MVSLIRSSVVTPLRAVTGADSEMSSCTAVTAHARRLSRSRLSREAGARVGKGAGAQGAQGVEKVRPCQPRPGGIRATEPQPWHRLPVSGDGWKLME
jgi:hypothetical protein